jgi:hypothetical protein
MALEQNVTAEHKVFVGDDKKVRFKVAGEDGVTPIDVTNIPMRWTLAEDNDPATLPKILKESGSGITVGGVFNVDPLVNTQYAEVQVYFDPAIVGKANYHHALRRTDIGSRNVLAFGRFLLGQAVP